MQAKAARAAERERQARVILGESEMQIAESFRQASLAEHAGLKVRLRFMLESFYSEIPAGGLTPARPALCMGRE